MTINKAKRPPLKKKSGKKKPGFTLLETVIGVCLMGVVFVGTMSLFTGTMATATKINTTTTSSIATANVMQRLSSEMKEAFLFALPTGTDTNWPATEDVTKYTYKDSSGVPHYTGIYLRYPQDSGVVQVYRTASSNVTTVTDVYDRSRVSNSTANDVLYYRGNPDGTPCPRPVANVKNSGTCLWAKIGIGSSVRLVEIVDNIANETAGMNSSSPPKETAVMFERADSGAAKVKVVCGGYSAVGRQVTSDNQEGEVLKEGYGGREVVMRNAAPANLNGGKGDHVTLDMPSGAPSATATPSEPGNATASTPATPTPTPTKSPSPTPTPYRSPTPTPVPTKTPTPSPVPTKTPTPTASPSKTPAPTPTPTPIRIG
jgi:type II secretory pathway pseudopilin PulG